MRTTGPTSRAALTLSPIGVIRSPHRDPGTTPIQPACAEGCRGEVEVFAAYAAGLDDVDGFSHVHLLYWLHLSGPPALKVTPFLDDASRGVFATRAPNRPNPLGLSVVRVVERRGRVLVVEDLDVLDGTPLLDIKPYIERFDVRVGTRGGWSDTVDGETFRLRGARGGTAAPADDAARPSAEAGVSAAEQASPADEQAPVADEQAPPSAEVAPPVAEETPPADTGS